MKEAIEKIVVTLPKNLWMLASKEASRDGLRLSQWIRMLVAAELQRRGHTDW